MKPDQHDALGAGRSRSRPRRPRAAGRRTRGRRRPRTRRPRSRVSPSAASAATASAMAMRWSPCERTAAPRSGRPPSMTRPSGVLLDRGAHAPQALGEGGDAVALLDAQLGRAGDAVNVPSAAARRPRPGRAPRRSARAPPPAARRRPRRRDERASIQPTGSGVGALDRRSRCRAPIARSTSRNAVRRGFSSTLVDAHVGVGQDERGHHQEGGAGDVAGHVQAKGAQRLAAARRTARRPRDLDRHAERGQQALRVVAAGLGSRTVVRAVGLQARQQDRRLHLRARHRQRPSRCPRSRRPRSSAAGGRPWSRRCAPIARSGRGHALDRPPAAATRRR